MNLPVGAVGLAILLLYLPLKQVKGDIRVKLKQIDYFGALLTIGGTSMIVLALNWGGTSFPWVSGQVLGCLLGGVAVFVLFLCWEGGRWVKIPIVPPSIFKERTVATVFQCTTFSGMTVLGQSYYIPQVRKQLARAIQNKNNGVSSPSGGRGTARATRRGGAIREADPVQCFTDFRLPC